MYYYDPLWPLESGRQFNSEYFTEEELWAKCQENDWLKTGGIEFDDSVGFIGSAGETDYVFSAYECYSLLELKRAFLRGNWAIRQCFTYKNLAFINQINGGDEWWAIHKDKDGTLTAFDSITMGTYGRHGVINHEASRHIVYRELHTTEYVYRGDVEREAEELTKTFQETFGRIGRFYVPYGTPDYGYEIRFEYTDHNYWRNYMAELLAASKLGWWGYREVDGVRVE